MVLSKALYNIGSTSDLISSRGVFSKIMCKFSRSVTVACTDFGVENTLLKQSESYCGDYTVLGLFAHLKDGRIIDSYSSIVDSWMRYKIGCKTAARTS